MIELNIRQNATMPSLDDARPWGLVKTVTLLSIAALALSMVAIINRFPLIFFDTSTYLDRAVAIAKLAFGDAHAAQQVQAALSGTAKPTTGSTYSNPFFLRPFTYSAFLVPFATRYTFLLVPFVQGLLSAYVIRRLLNAMSLASVSAFAICIGLLAVFSSLPVTAAYVMPDIFTGLLIAFSFAVVHGWSTRSVPGRVFDAGLMTFLIAVHLSHIPIALAISVMFVIVAFLFRGSFRLPFVAGGVIAPLIVAPLILIASNVVVANKPVISESSSLFLLARFVGDGMTQQYLRTACPKKDYVLCPEIDRLYDADSHGSISDYFLWGKHGAVGRLSSPRLVEEAAELNRETLHAYFGQIVWNSVRSTVRQLITFQIDDDINNPPATFVTASVTNLSPSLTPGFLNSLQSRGSYPLEAARLLANVGLLVSLCVIGYLAAFHRHLLDRACWFLGLFALAGVAENALAIGALSEVHDRYQSRVMWLVPLVAIVFALTALSKTKRTRPAEQAPVYS